MAVRADGASDSAAVANEAAAVAVRSAGIRP